MGRPLLLQTTPSWVRTLTVVARSSADKPEMQHGLNRKNAQLINTVSSAETRKQSSSNRRFHVQSYNKGRRELGLSLISKARKPELKTP